MNHTVRPLRNPRVAIDLRALAVDSLKSALDEQCGGNEVLNRLEAEAWVEAWLHSWPRPLDASAVGSTIVRNNALGVPARECTHRANTVLQPFDGQRALEIQRTMETR